jgi:hypothetical protein
MTATMAARRARAAALNDLDRRWGEAYDLAVTRAGWIAKRLGNGRALVAGSPAELRALITADDDAGRARDVTGPARRAS